VMSASAPMMMTVSQSSMARGTLVGSSAASMSGGMGLAASSVGPDSVGVVIAGWSVRHARTPCHRADAGTRSVHLDREAVADARGSMTIHVSGVSLAGALRMVGVAVALAVRAPQLDRRWMCVACRRAPVCEGRWASRGPKGRCRPQSTLEWLRWMFASDWLQPFSHCILATAATSNDHLGARRQNKFATFRASSGRCGPVRRHERKFLMSLNRPRQLRVFAGLLSGVSESIMSPFRRRGPRYGEVPAVVVRAV